MRYATTHTTNSLTAFSGYRFHFNGKETDNEVYGEGNALDFGARIYDSRLGRWLSVDRFALKYPFASPYTYALNSPMMLKDVGGDSVWVTTTVTKIGKQQIITKTIHITGVILNNSSHPVDVVALAREVEDGLKNSMQLQEMQGNVIVVYKAEVSIKQVKSMDKVKKTDHLIVLVDHVTGKSAKGDPAGGVAKLYGQIAYVMNNSSTSFGWLVKSIIHEYGHNLGLEHTWEDNINGNDNDPMNYMSYSDNPISFDKDQIKQMFQNATIGSRSNLGDNYIKMKSTGPRLGRSSNNNPTGNTHKKGQITPYPLTN